jgi:hypothetical protein
MLLYFNLILIILFSTSVLLLIMQVFMNKKRCLVHKTTELFQTDDNFTNKYDETDTIFISIASYRDVDCPQTVKSIFQNAKRPNNIFIGICQQNNDTDIDCENEYKYLYKNNIKTIRVDYRDAKGPTWARYLCSTLLNKEQYFLQIDSHCLFVKNWDQKLVKMIKVLERQGYEKAILSHYTPENNDLTFDQVANMQSKDSVSTICTSFFNEDGIISFPGAQDQQNFDKIPKINAYIAGGMLFCKSICIKQVPFDPYLNYLFVGEEILHSIRFWTHGWDIFTPSEDVIYHYYTREESPHIWTDIKYSDEDATKKVKHMLSLDDISADELKADLMLNFDIYGLGNERTIQEYFKFTGIDVSQKKVSKSFCT